MQGSRGFRGSRTVAGLGALVLAAVLCLSLLVSSAGAARLVGKDGRVYACYKTKGKAKGQVRLVAKRGKCHHGEKKVSWLGRGAGRRTGRRRRKRLGRRTGRSGRTGRARARRRSNSGSRP